MRALTVLVFYILSVNVGSKFVVAASENPNNANILLKLEEGFEALKKHLSAIEVKLESLQESFENKMTSVSNDCAIRDISEAIKGQKFELAEEQLVEIGDDKKVRQIIHNVYAGSPVNADIVLDFVGELTHSDLKFQILTALNDEMRSSGHNDPLKLISLAEVVERELAREQHISTKVRVKAEDVKDSAIEDIKTASTNILKTAMIAGNYQKNVEIENLASAIFRFRTDVSVEVMERVVDSLFGVVAAARILDNISSHEHIPLVITGLKAIFNRFNYAGNLNNGATLHLASHLAQVKRRNGYKTTNRELRIEVDSIIDRLPTCARNLYFNTNVCFWNKGKNEYMYAASSGNNYDVERRSLYSWYAGDIVNGAMWHVEKIGDYYFFKNDHHANEYLYSAHGHEYAKDMRYVFTWMPGNNTDRQSEWLIELDGDFCYIKSVYNHEYLFASSNRYNRFNTHVFTWIGKTIIRSAEFQWQLRNCGQQHR